ncbi:MAG: hypothetical protein AAGL49_04135 [Pseudomonadota bacterium]
METLAPTLDALAQSMEPYALLIQVATGVLTIAFFLIAAGMANQAARSARETQRTFKSVETALSEATDLAGEVRQLNAKSLRAASGGPVKGKKAAAEPTRASFEAPVRKEPVFNKPAEAQRPSGPAPKFRANPAIAQATRKRRAADRRSPAFRRVMNDAAVRSIS